MINLNYIDIKELKNLDETNKGITDIENDRSLTRKGFVEHSGWDFTPEILGNFCKFIHEFLIAFKIPHNGTIIEFGCGSGVLSTCLSPDLSYIGLDGNPKAGPFINKENENQTFICADLVKEIRLNKDIKADVVMSWDFLEHLEDENIEKVLNNMDSFLKPNGIFISLIDTIILEEHISNHPLPWWVDKINSLTNWQLVDACWRHQNRESYWWQLFEKATPIFWQPNINNQMILIYRKM